MISISGEFILIHWNNYDNLWAIQDGVSENVKLCPFTFGIDKELSIYEWISA